MLTKTDIEKYFIAEKQVGLIFFVIGIVAVLLAIVFFFFLRTNFYRGAAIPLIVAGLLELIAGLTIYNKSDGDRVRNVYAFDMNPQELKEKELPRMQKVTKSFAIYKWVEVVLAVAGIVMIILYRSKPERAFWFGLGITLTLQALIMFSADYLAAKRARTYTDQLEAFVRK
jgi:ABC-type xylose transport system permease subunit